MMAWASLTYQCVSGPPSRFDDRRRLGWVNDNNMPSRTVRRVSSPVISLTAAYPLTTLA